MDTLVIYINRNLCKVLLFVITLLLEVMLWAVYIVSLPQSSMDSFGIFVYVASPLLILFSFFIYFIFRKISKSRLECYENQILFIKGKKKIEINIAEIKNIEFYRSWSWFFGDFSENQYVGIGMIDIELEDDNYRRIAIDRDDFSQIIDKYPQIFN